MTHPVSIQGTITLSDGKVASFCITPDVGYQQWGLPSSELWGTVDLLTALAEVSAEHIRDEDDE